MNMTDMELTPSELEMIRLKREQLELAKKEEEAKKAIQLEKDIIVKEEYIKKTLAKDREQINAANTFATDLGSDYIVYVQDRDEEVKIMGDYINKENGFDRHVLWSKQFKRKNATISRSIAGVGEYRISVGEQITYSSKWSTRGTSQGYKMYVNGPDIDWKQQNRAYARATKVNEVIKEAVSRYEYRKSAEESKKNALACTVAKMQKDYPNAKVEIGYDYERSYKGGLGTKFDTVTITFENKVWVTYRVYSDGSLSRCKMSFPNEKNAWDNMQTLNELKF